MLRAELRTLRLTEPFRIAHGTSAERTVLRVRYGDAVGEAPFVPYYKEDPPDTLRWLQSLAWTGGPAPAQGPRAGRLALDLLWHDIIGRQRFESLGAMWRLDAAKSPLGCRSFSIPIDLDSFAEKVREVSRQFRVLKLKVGSGNCDFDEAIVARACEAAPQATIMADANGGWSVAEAARLIPLLARRGIKLIEQPVHHDGGVEAWRELRAAMPICPVPLYADESTQKADDVRLFAGLADGVNVKLLKCGSIEQAKTMIRFARDLRMKVMLGCMIESSIGITAAAHLAPLADWIDLDGHLYVADDDYEGIRYDAEGRLVMPERPGIGVAPIKNSQGD